MPRNGSSVYSLPAGNPVVPGTTIATTWANSTLSDIATALTNSLSTDGSVATVSLASKTMTGGTFFATTVGDKLNLTGGQIQFPATQIPSADPNCLDDYEEGTWTPSFTFATPGNLGIAVAVNAGSYTKVGRLVYVTMAYVTSAFSFSTASGAASFTGLPFPNIAGVFRAAMPVSNSGGATVPGQTALNAIPGSGLSSVNLLSLNVSNGVSGNLNTSHFNTGVNLDFSFTGCYQTT